jgi:hypothetical protein
MMKHSVAIDNETIWGLPNGNVTCTHICNIDITLLINEDNISYLSYSGNVFNNRCETFESYGHC